MVCRVGHPLIPFSVVGYDKQPFRLPVKPPYRGESVVMQFGEIFHDGGETVVPVSRDTAVGLVEHIVMVRGAGVKPLWKMIFFLHSTSVLWSYPIM